MDGPPKRPLTDEPLCLDLVNTQWVDGGTTQDLLDWPDQLEAWLRAHRLEMIRDRSATAHALRHVRQLLRRCLETDDEDGEARFGLNQVLSRGCVIPQVAPDGPVEEISVEPDWQAAWTAARDYLRLRSKWPRWRIRACAHPSCILYFLDATRNGTRRWCDMRTCGNRAKVQRYKRRRVQS